MWQSQVKCSMSVLALAPLSKSHLQGDAGRGGVPWGFPRTQRLVNNVCLLKGPQTRGASIGERAREKDQVFSRSVFSDRGDRNSVLTEERKKGGEIKRASSLSRELPRAEREKRNRKERITFIAIFKEVR